MKLRQRAAPWPRHLAQPASRSLPYPCETADRVGQIKINAIGALTTHLSLPHSKLDNAPLIVRNSVQVYPYKIANLGFEPVMPGGDDLFVLPESWVYDPECYGYMARWLASQEFVLVADFSFKQAKWTF